LASAAHGESAAFAPRHCATLARSVRLLSAFRRERSEPEYFYDLMARDTVAQLGSYTGLEGATVIDVGTGFGFFARALAAAGARCTGIDHDLGELTARWLEGSVTSVPGTVPGYGPDEETGLLVPVLAAANRRFITSFSRPA